MLTMNAQVLLMGWRGRAGLSALVISRTARTRPFVGWSVSQKGFRTSPARKCSPASGYQNPSLP